MRTKEELEPTRRPFTTETAKAAQAAGVRKRKENRTFREIIAKQLSKGTSKQDIIDAIIADARKGNLAAYDRLVRDLQEKDGAKVGENVIQLVVDKETADILKSL